MDNWEVSGRPLHMVVDRDPTYSADSGLEVSLASFPEGRAWTEEGTLRSAGMEVEKTENSCQLPRQM